MASMRRSLSSQIRESRAPTTTTTVSCRSDLSSPPFLLPPSASSSSPPSSSSSPFSSFMRAVVMAMALEGGKGSSSSKMSSWKKLLLQFGVCFAVGLLLGWLTPQQWQLYAPEKVDGSIERNEVDALFGRAMTVNTFKETEKVAEIGHSFSGVEDVVMPLEPRKLLIVVTPTYTRPFKAYYLTRLAHTLKLVPPPVLWLVVEMQAQSLETAALLRETGLMYRHLVCDRNLTDVKDRGTHQRNTALAHIEQHQLDGIVYFADDDNVYTLELFHQMRQIQRFGTWLVGMLAPGKSRAILEGPVCREEKVIGWHTNEKSKRLRRFHVDMSGFAFNSTILWDPRRWKRPTLEPIRQLDTIKEGFQETTFIEQLVPDESHMEGRPPGCLKVMVWHLHLEAPKGFAYPSGWTLLTPLHANIPARKDS